MNIVDRLQNALSDLEKTVGNAKGVLEGQGAPSDPILKRFAFYENILMRQRCLTTELRSHFEKEEWTEVIRCVRLITALSAMVRDDAEMLTHSSGKTELPLRVIN